MRARRQWESGCSLRTKAEVERDDHNPSEENVHESRQEVQSAVRSYVGSEVHRAIRWKNRGDRIKAANFCNKAIEFLRIMQEDPKNIHRAGEFEEGIYELQDYFQGENLYNTSDDVLIRYYDSFLEVYERTTD